MLSFARRFFEERWVIPLALLVLIAAMAAFAPLISTQDPYDLAAVRLEDSYVPPIWTEAAREARAAIDEAPAATAAPAPDALQSPATPVSPAVDPSTALAPVFLLGTDSQGRDVFSAILYGLRVSLFVGFSGTAVALTLGVLAGLLAGYYRGRLDSVLMRAADIQLSFPSVLIALFLMAVWGQGVSKIIIAVGIVHWVLYARIARGLALVEREKDYVAAIRSMGAGPARILLRHLLPNMIVSILVVSVVQFASIVILEATLSFLGLGVPITRPSLGMLIKFGYDEFFSGNWWVWLFPGLALMLLVLSMNWLGDLLRERLRVET